MKLLLDNVYLNSELKDFNCPINVNIYKIYPELIISMTRKKMMKHQQNSYVEFKNKQPDSIIFSGGTVVTMNVSYRRKFIEDILLIGSIITEWNWCLNSRRSLGYFWKPRSNLEGLNISGKNEMEQHLNIAVNKILDPAWQKQYENGFHLRMLINHANIHHCEGRFLLNVTLWEWLYPHLKNPKGATTQDETNNLQEVFNFVLNHFWPKQYKKPNQKNIFHVLRNQIAHSGKVPIDRSYAEQWMARLVWDSKNRNDIDLKCYLHFFDLLTQVVVLKTLGIDADNLIQRNLSSFLTNGKI